MSGGVVTLHRKGVKKWLSQTEKGDAVAAGMKTTAGHSGVVFGGRADATRARCREYKVKLY